MWPFLSHALFPPPSEAWLQSASWDPEAQGWGAWSGTEKCSLGLGGGDKEEDIRDADFLLSLLERENLAKCPTPAEELEAIKRKLWAMEQAMGPPELPRAQGQIRDKQSAGTGLAPPPISQAGCLETPLQKVEADHRSVYVGNVDYGGSAEELEAHFNHCGNIHRVTILCDKFSGHPKGYAYIEFASESSVQAAVGLDSSVFRGRIIKASV
ncbi:embryonic polyadenylate-binding protein 2 [Erinaceus europaeus]|uniref:Embryonic polyadenylate-binding protein 2 n=1 Tax=Erinaceus europaeus TaxID=9365 RepID=A0ABM3WWQ9_ERIEU|nr:embryonic polyadenylate-binding protein 2 [Erinaceus europaeus]